MAGWTALQVIRIRRAVTVNNCQVLNGLFSGGACREGWVCSDKRRWSNVRQPAHSA